MKGPLLSMTHSAPPLIAASVTSALEGIPVFRGHSNGQVPEKGGYAWSRGRWRGLKLSSVEPNATDSSSESEIQHVSIWSSIRLPVDSTSSVSVANPFGERIPATFQLDPDGEKSLVLLFSIPGHWTVKVDDETIRYLAGPGKPLGPLARWSRDPKILANGNDRPIRLFGVDCYDPTPLIQSKETQSLFAKAFGHSAPNLIRFTTPLLDKRQIELGSKTGALRDTLEKIDAMFGFLGKRNIYLYLSHSIFAPNALESLPRQQRAELESYARILCWTHWNVHDPSLADSLVRAPIAQLPARQKRLLRGPLDLDANSEQWTLIDCPDLESDTDTLSTALDRVVNTLESASINRSESGKAIEIGRGSYPDLAFDENGHVHIVYARNGTLYHRHWNPDTQILSEENDTSLRYGGSNNDGPQRSDPEIAIDPRGRLHVLVGAHYAIRENGKWQAVTTLFQRDTALAMDSQGNAFVCKRGGNHHGEVGIDILPTKSLSFQPTPADPDVGTVHGEAWSIGKDHPYGHVFTGADDTLYLTYRQGAPDYFAWRATRNQGQSWFGGGVYGGDHWQSEAPSGVADGHGNVFIIGPTGWLLAMPPRSDTFHIVGHAINCGSRELPTLEIADETTLAIASFGGRLALLKSGALYSEQRIASPDGNPVGFVGLASSPKPLRSFRNGPRTRKRTPIRRIQHLAASYFRFQIADAAQDPFNQIKRGGFRVGPATEQERPFPSTA